MTQKERIDRLEAENDRLSAENSSLAESVSKLTATLAAAERARDQHAADLRDARTQLEATESAAAVVSQQDGPADDEPRWLKRYTGTDPCEDRLVANADEQKALQDAMPDNWYQDEADARKAYHRREQAALAGDSDGTE